MEYLFDSQNCREANGVHTCDKRNTASYIASRFPGFEIEVNMTEDDQLWNQTVRETPTEVAARAKTILDDIFENCNGSTCMHDWSSVCKDSTNLCVIQSFLLRHIVGS